MITNGNTIKVHYTGKLSNGEQFDSSIGRDPLSFTVGRMEVIPGFENAVLGKEVGDKVQITIPSDEAYGDVDENLIVKVDNQMLNGQKFGVGQNVQVMTEQGPHNVVVKEVYDSHIIIDGNHPLAGKELMFDIEVLEVL